MGSSSIIYVLFKHDSNNSRKFGWNPTKKDEALFVWTDGHEYFGNYNPILTHLSDRMSYHGNLVGVLNYKFTSSLVGEPLIFLMDKSLVHIIFRWVQSQVESHQRLKKWFLVWPRWTLSIIRYGSRVKRSNPGNSVKLSPTPRCRSYWKGSLQVTLN